MPCMTLEERIIKYIENHNPISYTTIVQVAAGKGFNEMQVLQALDKVGRNKGITTKTRKDEVWYYLVPAPAPVIAPTYHSWLRGNYPPMTADNDGSGIDVDFSWLFLRTAEERDAYRAEAKGVPMYVYNKRYERDRRSA
jgi:hypothetical protein